MRIAQDLFGKSLVEWLAARADRSFEPLDERGELTRELFFRRIAIQGTQMVPEMGGSRG
jgi:hypothetical protein